MCISIHVTLYFNYILQLKNNATSIWEMSLQNYQSSYILTLAARM
jgi:hypothetical protein